MSVGANELSSLQITASCLLESFVCLFLNCPARKISRELIFKALRGMIQCIRHYTTFKMIIITIIYCRSSVLGTIAQSVVQTNRDALYSKYHIHKTKQILWKKDSCQFMPVSIVSMVLLKPEVVTTASHKCSRFQLEKRSMLLQSASNFAPAIS